MKKYMCFLFSSIAGIVGFAQTNPTPVYKPGTTILNSSSNNSVSGVNPNGNPGTILYNNSNSNAINNTLITPNRAVTTTIISTPNNSPIVTRESRTIPANNVTTVTTTTAVNPNESAKTAVETRIETAPVPAATVTTTRPVNNTVAGNTVVNISGNTSTGLKPLSSSPVLANYIPESIVTKLKTTYADKLYDITMLKKSDNQLLYIVRIHENGAYITHYLDAEGNVIR